MNPPVILTHPLALSHLTEMRRFDTPPRRFRWHLHRLAEMLFLEASRSLDTSALRVLTPLAETAGAALARPIVLVPVLRAGLGLSEAILPLVPDAVVAHLGIRRDEETAKPVPYYANLPAALAEADVFLLDPMLATGGSACAAAAQLKAAGARRMRMINVVSCPEGLAALGAEHPDVPVFTAALDDGLNEKCYIVPGLGDAGDRCFGT
ncbi:MAG TPA: uracil phosphoribosyltransferase [Verrucomicrobiales bacterium]|nr:uracil phosphoribosyltransferase [Verrucomicrobiales bacterium]